MLAEDDYLFPFLQSKKYITEFTSTKEEVPEILYKFRSWGDVNHQKIISDREIYFARPKELDANAEFTVPIDHTLPSDNTLRAFYYQDCLCDFPNFSESQRFEYVEERLREFKSMIEDNSNHIEEIIKEEDQKLQNLIGIFCTCPDSCNNHLWDNFANGGKGFCVGFKTSKFMENPEFFGFLGPVNYYSKDTKPIISNISFSDSERISKYLIRVISIPENLSDEKEYRFVKHQISKRNIKLDPEYYEEIILGPNMSNEQQQEIITTTKRCLAGVKVLKAKYNKQFDFIYTVKINQ